MRPWGCVAGVAEHVLGQFDADAPVGVRVSGVKVEYRPVVGAWPDRCRLQGREGRRHRRDPGSAGDLERAVARKANYFAQGGMFPLWPTG